MFIKIHHIAIICSDYEKSKQFYTKILGLEILAEHYREVRKSWKLDLALEGQFIIELFSFPDPPKRPSKPESSGLRHLAFEVNNIEKTMGELANKNIFTEPLRTDPYTGKKFTFFND